MSIQFFINRATALEINRRKVAGVQYTRSEVARTETTVTKNPWRFTVSVAPMPWADARPYLENIDALGNTTPETIQLNGANVSFLYRYLGDRATQPTSWTVSNFIGNQLIIGNINGVNPGQYAFRSGDLVQITGKPYPYTVVNDVIFTGAGTIAVTTHRPNIITTGTSGLIVRTGTDCQFNMFCPNMPGYKLISGAHRRLPQGTYTNGAIVEFTEPLQLVEWTYGS